MERTKTVDTPLVAPATFRDACSLFATGVAIACALDPDGNPHGLTISSLTAVSLAPPMILICIDGSCKLLQYFRISQFFSVNVLSRHQQPLSVSFAVKPERRFEGVSWTPGQTGVPLIDGSLAAIECRTTSVIEAGDHAVVFGEVVGASAMAGEPLLYFNRGYRQLI